jgi:antitoxin FitA
MAQVLVRNLDDAVVARLKRIAERENMSLEQKFRDMAVREGNASENRREARFSIRRP